MLRLLCTRRYYQRYQRIIPLGPSPQDNKIYIHLTNIQHIFTMQTVLIQEACTAEKKEWLMQYIQVLTKKKTRQSIKKLSKTAFSFFLLQTEKFVIGKLHFSYYKRKAMFLKPGYQLPFHMLKAAPYFATLVKSGNIKLIP